MSLYASLRHHNAKQPFHGCHLNWIRQRRHAIAHQHVAIVTTPVQVRAPGLLWVFGEHGYFQLLVEGSSFGQPVDQDNAESVIAELFPEAKLVRLANIRYPGDEVIFEYPNEP